MKSLAELDWQSLALVWGGRTLGFLAILMVGVILARKLATALERAMTRAELEPIAIQFLRKIAYCLLLIVLLVIALQYAGVPMASMFAVLGAAGLAIGLALKDSLSNIASGVLLVALKPFKTGDLVTINSETGTVESVSIFLTSLRGADNQTIVLPNSLVTSDSIINHTPDDMRRVQLLIGIAYGADIDKARSTALRLVHADPRVMDEPEPSVIVSDLADDRVILAIRCHTNNSDNFAVKCDLTERIKQAFEEAGVAIPRPQREVHLYHHGGEDTAPAPESRRIDGND